MGLIREMIPDGVVEPKDRDSIVKPYLMSHGTLECYNLNETRKFYEEFLGLECVRHAPLGMAVRLGLKFHVICLEVGATLQPVSLGNHWGVDVESKAKVDEAYQNALKYQIQYQMREIGHPTQQHGAYSFYMEDLDHNWWEIQHIPNFLHDDLFEFGDLFGTDGQPIGGWSGMEKLMQLLTYKNASGQYRAGVKLGEAVFDAETLTGLSECATILSILQDWDALESRLIDRVSNNAHERLAPVEIAALGPPVLYPGAIYCAAANFRDHMHAMAVKLNQPDEPDPRELDIKPYHFVVPGRTCIASPDEPLRLPLSGTNIDWEIELVAVIGRPAQRVSPERALEHVAAYAIGNDVSIRDQRYLKIPNVPAQSLFRTDFIAMKGWDQSCVIGPWLTLARDIPDPQRLAMKLWVDDELMQDSSTAQMIFSVAEQIAYLSSRVTLLPGDLVMTGTPAGTGMERDRFLRPGETLRLSIEGIGEMSQRVIA